MATDVPDISIYWTLKDEPDGTLVAEGELPYGSAKSWDYTLIPERAERLVMERLTKDHGVHRRELSHFNVDKSDDGNVHVVAIKRLKAKRR